VLQGVGLAGNDVEQHLKFFLARSGHAGGENMYRNDGTSSKNRSSADGFKTGSPIYPTKRMREGTGRLGEWGQIAGNVERLNTELSIALVGCVAPSAGL